MKPRRTKTPQIKRNWMRGVKLSGNKFANMYLFFLLPRFLPAAVRWLTGSEARPNTFCAAHTHTHTHLGIKMNIERRWNGKSDEPKMKLSRLLWGIISRCGGCSSSCTTRKSRGSSWREENKPRYLRPTPAWTRGRETGERVRLLALTRKQFFLPQDTISEHSHCT